MTTLAFVKSIV